MTIKFTLFVLLWSTYSFAQIGIGTTTPSATATLELSSTTKGFLPPRLTATERDAIANPAQGLIIYNTTLNSVEFFNGVRWINYYPSSTETDVYNPITNKIWMDRNLGASQVATSSDDFNAFGSLFQWGRGADGHELMTWTSATQGTPVHNAYNDTRSDAPGNTFIATPTEYTDWRSTQNDNLWQGVNGTNNPCPNGYRLPTSAEYHDEFMSWTDGPFSTPLKLPSAGFRRDIDGQISTGFFYWTSTIGTSGSDGYAIKACALSIYDTMDISRSVGCAIRCIRN
jgi:hypothetical protein